MSDEQIRRLKEDVDDLRVQNNERAGLLLRIAHILGDAPVRAESELPEAVADLITERDLFRDQAIPEAAATMNQLSAERDRLRAVVKGSLIAIETIIHGDHVDLGVGSGMILGRVSHALKQALDGSGDMGGRLTEAGDVVDYRGKRYEVTGHQVVPITDGTLAVSLRLVPSGGTVATDVVEVVMTAEERTDTWHLINQLADEVEGIDGNVIRGWLDTTVREAVMGGGDDS